MRRRRRGLRRRARLLGAVAEAWTDSAIRHGIPAAQAATLVTETMAGTAALLTQTDTLALRRGGRPRPAARPRAGSTALERGGVRAALADAMDAVVGGLMEARSRSPTSWAR